MKKPLLIIKGVGVILENNGSITMVFSSEDTRDIKEEARKTLDYLFAEGWADPKRYDKIGSIPVKIMVQKTPNKMMGPPKNTDDKK